MKKLGFGMMRLPLLDADDAASIDVELVKKMVDVFMERGFTYFDTAYPYHKGCSEAAVREAVVNRYPRDSFTLTDKLPCWEINTPEDMERIFNEQLERAGVEYFDYYWLHAMRRSYIEVMDRMDGWGFVARKKAEGKIRHIGFSFHDEPAVLEEILEKHPEMEYVQLQINYLDWNNPTIQSRECYELCTRYGKPVIVMEPVKGGALANVPPSVEEMFKAQRPDASPASWAIRYCATLDNVMMVLSGMSTLEQVEDNTSYMREFEPLDDKEKSLVASASGIINEGIAIGCTACHYCTDGCPMNIAIPEYFSIYNMVNQFDFERQMNVCATYFGTLAKVHGVPSDCIECGQCEEHCPQHLPIIENLKKVKEVFEK